MSEYVVVVCLVYLIIVQIFLKTYGKITIVFRNNNIVNFKTFVSFRLSLRGQRVNAALPWHCHVV